MSTRTIVAGGAHAAAASIAFAAITATNFGPRRLQDVPQPSFDGLSRREAHRRKMDAKKIERDAAYRNREPRIVVIGSWTQRQQRLAARRALKLSGNPTVFANIGSHHEDYGMTPAEHAFAKANRPQDSKALLGRHGPVNV